MRYAPDYEGFPTRLSDEIIENKTTVVDRSHCTLKCVSDGIGETPLVELSRFAKAKGLKCRLFGKLEYINPGGSVKDRIARRMINQALETGLLKHGDILIEASSGNTGVGLALMCAEKGIPLIVVMPQKMSMEKQFVLEALGTKVVRTRTSAQSFDIDSHLSIAYRMRDAFNAKRKSDDDPKCVILDQYKSIDNPKAHYLETGNELVRQMGDRTIDVFVAGAGTGGTLTGVAKKLREVYKGKCHIVGVDPEGSILHCSPESNPNRKRDPYCVEGIGYDFYPATLDWKCADEWVVVGDKESFATAREAILLEGILIGGSCGTALSAAVRVGKKLTEDKNLVVILPDSSRNYVTKFMSNDWLALNGFEKPTSKLTDLRELVEERYKEDLGQEGGDGEEKSSVSVRHDWTRSLKRSDRCPNFLCVSNDHDDGACVVECYLKSTTADILSRLRNEKSCSHIMIYSSDDILKGIITKERYCNSITLDDHNTQWSMIQKKDVAVITDTNHDDTSLTTVCEYFRAVNNVDCVDNPVILIIDSHTKISSTKFNDSLNIVNLENVKIPKHALLAIIDQKTIINHFVIN